MAGSMRYSADRRPPQTSGQKQDSDMAEEEAIPTQPQGQQQEQQIAIQKIYMKDFSFESPNSPQVFTGGDWSPKTNPQSAQRTRTGRRKRS